MAPCAVREAVQHALPGGYFSRAELIGVSGACSAEATVRCRLRGMEKGNRRDGAELRAVDLCGRHLEALHEIDRRLRGLGWGSMFAGNPEDL